MDIDSWRCGFELPTAPILRKGWMSGRPRADPEPSPPSTTAPATLPKRTSDYAVIGAIAVPHRAPA